MGTVDAKHIAWINRNRDDRAGWGRQTTQFSSPASTANGCAQDQIRSLVESRTDHEGHYFARGDRARDFGLGRGSEFSGPAANETFARTLRTRSRAPKPVPGIV